MSARRQEILDQYRLAVEMADRVSARRGQANQFYLSLESLILGAPFVLRSLGSLSHVDSAVMTTLLAAVGAVVGGTWWLQLRSYRDLNRAKFAVINRLEGRFLHAKIFSDEWESLKKDPLPVWRGRYAELGTIERVVPWIFVLLNVGVVVWVWL